MSPPKPRAVRDEHGVRMCLLSALDPPEASKLVRGHLETAEQMVAELKTLAETADTSEHPRGSLCFGRLALQYGIFPYEAQRKGARWALDQLEAEDLLEVVLGDCTPRTNNPTADAFGGPSHVSERHPDFGQEKVSAG